MQGRRTGKLTNEATYHLHFEQGMSVAELADGEGVRKGAIYLRLERERQRRAAAGLPIHHGKRGRKSKSAVAGLPAAVEPTLAAARGMYEGIFDGLNRAIEQLQASVSDEVA